MDIKPLLELVSAKVASIIKGKTTEEIRKTFNITMILLQKKNNKLLKRINGVWKTFKIKKIIYYYNKLLLLKKIIVVVNSIKYFC